MKNITDNYNNTIFIDLDGTLVVHNYDPENVNDEIIPSVLDFIKTEKNKGSCLILTTARKEKHCIDLIGKLYELGIEFNHCIFELPAGKRILVNDRKEGSFDKAQAINLDRNKGFDNWIY